jgi:hypothetical protein
MDRKALAVDAPTVSKRWFLSMRKILSPRSLTMAWRSAFTIIAIDCSIGKRRGMEYVKQQP